MRIRLESSTITQAQQLCEQQKRAAVTACEASALLWKPPFRASAESSPGALIAQLQTCGTDDPTHEMRETQKALAAAFKKADEHLDRAGDISQQLWLASNWVKSGNQPTQEVMEPIASYCRTLVDGGRAGLVDTLAISKELLSLSNKADERLSEIRRAGRKYISAASIILAKRKAEYLAQFDEWKVAVPALRAKAERLVSLHRAQFPSHRRSAVTRRGAKS